MDRIEGVSYRLWKHVTIDLCNTKKVRREGHKSLRLVVDRLLDSLFGPSIEC